MVKHVQTTLRQGLTYKRLMIKLNVQDALNISRSKDNQAMGFGQLIKHNIKKIFLEKPHIKCSEKTSPRPFWKKSKLSTPFNQQCKVLYNLLLLFFQVEGYRNILQNFKKRGLKLESIYFSMVFEENISQGCIPLNNHISLPDCLYLMRCWAICVLELFVSQYVTS